MNESMSNMCDIQRLELSMNSSQIAPDNTSEFDAVHDVILCSLLCLQILSNGVLPCVFTITGHSVQVPVDLSSEVCSGCGGHAEVGPVRHHPSNYHQLVHRFVQGGAVNAKAG